MELNQQLLLVLKIIVFFLETRYSVQGPTNPEDQLKTEQRLVWTDPT